MNNIEEFEQTKEVFKLCKKVGIVIRVTFNVMVSLPDNINFLELIGLCKMHKINQFSLRQLTIPQNCKNKEVSSWIKSNTKKDNYTRILQQFEKCNNYPIVRKLNFGAIIYDVEGTAFTYFDHCIQETNNTNDMRSLIYQADGHLYTSWGSPASILF